MKILSRSHPEPLKVVIVGAGEVGFHIAERLSAENKQVVIIDTQADALKRVTEYLDVQSVLGSGSSPVTLDQAGVGDCDILLAVTDSDETNIIACLFANVLAPEALKLARIRNEEYLLYKEALSKDILKIGMVINPEMEAIRTIERLISVPGAVDYGEFVGGKIKMVGIRIDAGQCELVGGPITSLRRHIDPEVIIAAIIRGEKLIIPSGQDMLLDGDLIYFVCEDRDLQKVLRAFGFPSALARNVMIIGGGNLGYRLASLFERKAFHSKLVDRNEMRCEFLAQNLNRVIVLKGDGTDQDFLEDENVGDMDVVVSVTGDEETNVLSSLLAKNLGARKTITRINKVGYLPLLRAVGIEHSVSPRLSAINSILQYVRRGRIINTVSIQGEDAEVLEAIARRKIQLL